jgi:signal recognition particle subunit SRP14
MRYHEPTKTRFRKLTLSSSLRDLLRSSPPTAKNPTARSSSRKNDVCLVPSITRGRPSGAMAVTNTFAVAVNDNVAGSTSPSSETFADLHLENPVPVLVRATDGESGDKRKSRVKLSTVVQPEEMDSFFTRYAEVCKAGMTGLKKRDRSKRKKDKAKKKKAGADAEKKS